MGGGATRARTPSSSGCEDHLGHCVTGAIEAGSPDASDRVREASVAIERLVRS